MSTNARNMAACRTCGEIIARSAKVCPKCGEKKPIKGTRGWTALAMLGVFTLVGIQSCISDSLLTPEQRAQKEAQQAATKAEVDAEMSFKDGCRTAIRGNTRHPSTVKLDWGGEYTVAANGDRQLIQGFSAKNSFGLEIHQTARCTLTHDGKFNLRIIETSR